MPRLHLAASGDILDGHNRGGTWGWGAGHRGAGMRGEPGMLLNACTAPNNLRERRMIQPHMSAVAQKAASTQGKRELVHRTCLKG